MEKLNFSEEILGAIDKMLLDNDVEVTLDFPAGKRIPVIKDTAGGGPPVQLFLIFNGTIPVFREIAEMMELNEETMEKLVKGMLALLADSILTSYRSGWTNYGNQWAGREDS